MESSEKRPNLLAPPPLRPEFLVPWHLKAATFPQPAYGIDCADVSGAASEAPSGLQMSCTKLGAGASGEVFDGCLNGNRIAVKVVRGPVSGKGSNRKVHEQWMREKRTALVLARRPHRNLLKYFAAFEAKEDNGVQNAKDGVIIMERGEPVDTPLTEPRDDPLGPVVYKTVEKRVKAAERTACIAVSLVNALAHLHSVGKSIHRDVKPDNILRTEDGRICLCDFSATRTQMYSMQRASTQQGIGTMGFLAPEMYMRGSPYCAKVDTWSLGCTLLAFYNCGRPFVGGEFYQLTSILQWDATNEERLMKERCKLDGVVMDMLHSALPDNDKEVVVALRHLIGMCLRSDPLRRPSIAALLGTDELRTLAEASRQTLDDMPDATPAVPGTPESADVVSALIRNLIERFDFTQTGCLDKWELDLVRDRLHRSLEEKDVRSLELLGCWLDFQKGCPEADLATPDDATGRTLLHALAQSDRAEELMALVEDHCEEAYPGHADIPLTPLIGVRDREGHTPLWLAAAAGTSPPFCVRLLELGADVNARDEAGVTCLQRCIQPGYQRPGENRVDVVTALRAFGGQSPKGLGEQQPRNLTMQLLTAARMSMIDAGKIVSKLQEHLSEAREQRKLARMSRMCKSAPMLPLMRNSDHKEPVVMDVEDDDSPCSQSEAANMATESETLAGGASSEARQETSPAKINVVPPAVAGQLAAAALVVPESASFSSPEADGVATVGDLQTFARVPASPVTGLRATSSGGTPAQRSIGSKSGQRPPTMPKRRSIDGVPEASPVVPRSLFQNRSRPSPSASASPSASPSPRSERAQSSEPCAKDAAQDKPSCADLQSNESENASANDLEKRLRQHLLKLGKNHVQSAFRYADKDCDNHVGAEDIRHCLLNLHLSEGDEVNVFLKYFGRGMGMKSFTAWLRGKVNVVDTCKDMDQSMRRSSSHRPTWTASGTTRTTSASQGARARSTDGFPRKAAAMLAAEPGEPAANATDARQPAYVLADPISVQCGPGLSASSLEPVVRSISLNGRPDPRSSTSAAWLPSLSELHRVRSRSPAKLLPLAARTQSNFAESRSAHSPQHGSHRTGHRSASGGSSRQSSLRRSAQKSHDAAV